jgi:hypothetical protein
MTLSLVVSCNLPFIKKDQAENTGALLVKAYGKTFTTDDLKQLIPEETPQEDSIQMAKNFIDNWIRKQVVLHQAEKNLPDKMKQVEKQLEEYRTSLITYIYESELINQRLDTSVSEQEIVTYYKNNPRNFELKNNILKASYVKVKREAPKLDKLRKWFQSGTDKDKNLLAEYCYQFASDFRLDDETWIYFDELIKSIPIRTYDQEHFLRNNRNFEISDSAFYYLVRINDFKIKESLSPIEFERENIRALILNKRKLELVKEMEQRAIRKAMLNREIEVYTDEKN